MIAGGGSCRLANGARQVRVNLRFGDTDAAGAELNFAQPRRRRAKEAVNRAFAQTDSLRSLFSTQNPVFVRHVL
jgi:hypothetical protein